MSNNRATRDRWDFRLHLWAAYVLLGGAGCKISGAYTDLAGGGTVGSHKGDGIPPYIGNALDTNRLVAKLSDELQRALIAWYALPGTNGAKAAALGCHINTLTNRVDLAIGRLEAFYRSGRIKNANAVVEKCY